MRDFRDAKAMAHALRASLASKGLKITVGQSLELIADLFGLPDAGIYVNSAETACAATLYRVPWIKLRSLMMREPALQLNLLNRVAYDLREAGVPARSGH